MSPPIHHFAGVCAFLGKAVGRWAGIAGLCFFLFANAFGQEALRASLAGASALAAQKQAVANQGYNLKMGDLKLRFVTALGVAATDNVNNTEKNTQADLSLRPELDVTAVFPVTDKNTLALTLGGGYAKYAKTKARDNFFLTPDSTISFNIYAGDFVFNLHTHFTYTQDTYQQTDITGGSYGYFQNLSGVSATWDLNKLIFTFSYDHEIYNPTETQYAYQGRASELLNARAVFLLNPTTQLGLEAGFSTTAFDVTPSYTNVYVGFASNNITHIITPIFTKTPVGNFLSNQKSVNLGPYFQSSLSEHLRLTLSAGYTISFQETASSYAPAGNSAAYYFDLAVQHTVNARLGYSLNVGHQVRQGLTSDSVDYYYLSLSPSWRATEKVTVNLPLSATYNSSTGIFPEKYQYYTLGLSTSYRLSQKLTLTGSYNYRRRNSDRAGANYDQNELVLDTRYSF